MCLCETAWTSSGCAVGLPYLVQQFLRSALSYLVVCNVNMMHHFILCKLYMKNSHFDICQKTSGSILELSVKYPISVPNSFRNDRQFLHMFVLFPFSNTYSSVQHKDDPNSHLLNE